MAREVPPLGNKQWSRIIDVMVAWSEAHPRAHLPVLQLGDGSELTPTDIGRAVTDSDSWIAQLFYRAFAVSQLDDPYAPAEPLDEILLDFELDTHEWQLGQSIG